MPIKIEVDFSLLKKAVKTMGAEDLDVVFEDLKKGIVVDLSDIESINGVLSWQGHQIIIWIQDHSHRNMFEEAIKDGSKGNRFHVAECHTIEMMRSINRFERYVIPVTNNPSGEFFITGENYEEGTAELQVCRNCLKELNYKGYRNLEDESKKADIVKEFHIPKFFKTHDSYFSTLPSHRAGASTYYTLDWGKVSEEHKEKQNFICEGCGVNLSQPDHRKLLETHHKNGRKNENSEDNLQALCVDCHSSQPLHQHMNNSQQRKKIGKIKQLRQEQGLDQSDPPQEELF